MTLHFDRNGKPVTGRSLRLAKEWGRVPLENSSDLKPIDWSICAWCDAGNKKLKGQGACAECLKKRPKPPSSKSKRRRRMP